MANDGKYRKIQRNKQLVAKINKFDAKMQGPLDDEDNEEYDKFKSYLDRYNSEKQGQNYIGGNPNLEPQQQQLEEEERPQQLEEEPQQLEEEEEQPQQLEEEEQPEESVSNIPENVDITAAADVDVVVKIPP